MPWLKAGWNGEKRCWPSETSWFGFPGRFDVYSKNASCTVSSSFFSCFVVRSPDPAAEIKPEQKTKENKSQIFTLIAAGASTVQTLSSDFSQERHLSMLKEPLISIGKFAYEKPDRLYWEIVKPSPMGFVVQGDKARRWSGDSGVTETLESRSGSR